MRLCIFDGNMVFNQAYYALPPLLTSEGIRTGGIYGALRIIRSVLNTIKPDRFCIMFDRPEPTFRHNLDPNYKKNRNEHSYTFYDEFDRFKNLLRMMNVAVYEKSGYEADDLIGTVAVDAQSCGYHTVIYSNDRDMLQLLDENIFIFKNFVDIQGTHSTFVSKESFIKDHGYSPHSIVDIKAFAGDPSDNLKGVLCIGEVTATKLIRVYGTLEDVYAAYPNIIYPDGTRPPERVLNYLKDGKSVAFHTKKMCTIVKNVPFEFEYESMIPRPAAVEAYEIFEAYSFTELSPNCLCEACKQ